MPVNRLTRFWGGGRVPGAGAPWTRQALEGLGTGGGGGRGPPPLAQLGGNAGRKREGRQAFSNTSTDSGSSPQSKFACATTLLPGMLIASSLPSATIGSDNRQ